MVGCFYNPFRACCKLLIILRDPVSIMCIVPVVCINPVIHVNTCPTNTAVVRIHLWQYAEAAPWSYMLSQIEKQYAFGSMDCNALIIAWQNIVLWWWTLINVSKYCTSLPEMWQNIFYFHANTWQYPHGSMELQCLYLTVAKYWKVTILYTS